LSTVGAGSAGTQNTIYNNGAECRGLDGLLRGLTAANFALDVGNTTMTGATIKTFA